MPKCIFCGKDEHAHKGMNYLKNDGTVNYFCSSKCKSNALKLKRDKRKVRWADAFHEKREKMRVREKAKAEALKAKAK